MPFPKRLLAEPLGRAGSTRPGAELVPFELLRGFGSTPLPLLFHRPEFFSLGRGGAGFFCAVPFKP